jgi:hypothetical protein
MTKQNIIISSICVLVVFFSNFIVPSQINGFPIGLNFALENCWENAFSENAFESRINDSEFSRRPFVLEFQKWMYNKLNLPYQFSFNLINFISLFLLFLILPKLSKTISEKVDLGIVLQFAFLFSLPIIFAFYGSICTYDDIVQYIFLSAFLILLFNNNHYPAALFFLLACIARETSFIFLIIILAHFYQKPKWDYSKILIWLMSVIAYVIFIFLYIEDSILKESKNFLLEKRFWAWTYNFKDFKTFRETTTILLTMTGIPIYLLLQKIKTEQNHKFKYWSQISIIFILINAIIITLSGLVREARLLFVPLIFTLPLVSLEIKNAFLHLKKRWKLFEIKMEAIVLIGSLFIAFIWYSPKTVGTGYILKIYVFIYLLVFLEMIYSQYFKSKESIKVLQKT